MLTALALAAALSSQERPAADTATRASVAQAAEKPVCINEELTGSIFPRRVCHTAVEWKALNLQRDAAKAGSRSGPSAASGGVVPR